MKTDPISFRPTPELDVRLDALRARTGIPKSRLVEQLADEAERCRRYPGLAFRGPDERRRPWVIGTPFDVWQIVEGWQDVDGDAGRAQETFGLSARQLRLAVAYYREFTAEVDGFLALQRRPLSDLETDYPFIEVHRVAYE